MSPSSSGPGPRLFTSLTGVRLPLGTPTTPSSSETSIDLTGLPELDESELRFLWVHDYYDGALSGALVYRGEIGWFEYCGESGNLRRYVVRRLTAAQIADEQHWHALFVEHVGDHLTSREDGSSGTVRPIEEHARFYDAYEKRAPVDYSGNPIIGWVESSRW